MQYHIHDNILSLRASKAKQWFPSSKSKQKKKLWLSTKRLSLLTQRKHSPDSIYEYSFVTFSREVIGIRRKTTEN